MDDPITREVTVAAPPDVVWDALTDPAELAAGLGADAEVDLRVGGAIRFRWPDGSELRTGESGLAIADATVVAFTLEADDRGTRVTVTESPGVLGADGPLAMAEHA